MTEEVTVLHCANHPDRETVLRCNRCDKPICYECAVRTPVGMRCRECVRGQQDKYYNSQPLDIPIAVVVALALGSVMGALAFAFLGAIGLFSFILAFVLGPVAGGAIAEVIRIALKKRRARGMKAAAAVACAVGMLAGGFLLISLLGFRTPLIRLDVLLFTALAASTVYARLL